MADDLVVVQRFSDVNVARMAASALESEGIPVLVSADDAGGAYPFLRDQRGVRLSVPADREEEARRILGDLEFNEEE